MSRFSGYTYNTSHEDRSIYPPCKLREILWIYTQNTCKIQARKIYMNN